MPGFDRSGPMGAGPMTGGARGLCGRAAGAYQRPAAGGTYPYGRGMAYRRGFGGGFGRGGRGRGFGSRSGGYPYPPVYDAAQPMRETDEMAMLQADARAMRNSLAAVEQRIAELEKKRSE